MSELTREHFDGILTGLATKKDLEGLATKKDLEGLATKKDLEETEERLNLRLEAIHELLDVRNRVAKLEQDVLELKLHSKA